MADEKKVKQGKKSKAQGSQFELRVREDLEEKGWIVDKWTNNVELKKVDGCGEHLEEYAQSCGFGRRYYCKKCNGKLIKAKARWAGPNRPMMMGSGFPDFICFRNLESKIHDWMIKNVGNPYYCPKKPIALFDIAKEVIGVECKMSGELDKAEKEKCKWLLDQGIFSKILIAEKTKVSNRVVIVYHDFKEKYRRFYK